MFVSMSVKGFRGLKRLVISDLKRINLLAGRNNAGKTSLLEAVFLMASATNPISAITVSNLRGQKFGGDSVDSFWRPLFAGLDAEKPFRLSARWDDEAADRVLTISGLPMTSFAEGDETDGVAVARANGDFTLAGLKYNYENAVGQGLASTAVYDPTTRRINTTPPIIREDFARATFLSARSFPTLSKDAEQFSHLLKIKKETDVLDAMKIVEPRVQRIEVISEAGGPAVYVDLGFDSLLPIAVCGEGFVRLFSIIVELTSARGGVLLIDEVDNGLHHSVMEKLWSLLGEMSVRHDVQVIATTHNDEMIRSALRQLNETEQGVGLFRIDAVGDEHRVVAYDAEAIEGVLDGGFEVRA